MPSVYTIPGCPSADIDHPAANLLIAPRAVSGVRVLRLSIRFAHRELPDAEARHAVGGGK